MTKNILNLTNFHLPRWSELPTMELYSDQVISYILDVLAPLRLDEEDPLLTTSMINNYVKCRLIPPTNKKRYNQRHISFLIVVCVFKKIYSIPKIIQMIDIQKKIFETQVAYDYFCAELENSLQNISITEIKLAADTTKTGREERLFVRASVNAFALKLMVEAYLKSKDSSPEQ
ncbi:MAG: DUF1836 domain-containing protein [Anaerorhabdus sp.]